MKPLRNLLIVTIAALAITACKSSGAADCCGTCASDAAATECPGTCEEGAACCADEAAQGCSAEKGCAESCAKSCTEKK